MENQEHQEFDADAAFDEAAKEYDSGELTAESEPSDAEQAKQTTSEQRGAEEPQEQPEQPQNENAQTEQEDELPECLSSATDEVKDNFRKLHAENKRLAHMAKSQRGRVGALSKKYQQAQDALAQLQAQQDQGGLNADIEAIGVDYPEIAKAFNGVLQRLRQLTDGISKPVSQITEAHLQDSSAQELNLSIDYVQQIIPDAHEITHDPKFFAWLGNQPNGVIALFGSHDPNDAIYLLSEYKKALAADSVIKEQSVKRNQQLSAMALPNGRSAPKGNGEIDGNKLFDQLAEKYRKEQFI